MSTTTTNAITRRNFLSGAAGTVAAGALVGTAGAALASEKESSAAADATSPVPAWLGEEPADGDIVETKECDVLIIGAGNGGMAAAATASDLGVDFLIAESYDTPEGTRNWIGAINTVHTKEAGVEVDVERLQYELARYASFKCNQRLHKMWIDESAEMIDWLDPIMEAAGQTCTLDAEMGPEIDPTYKTGFYIPAQQHMYGAAEPGAETLERNVVLQQHIEAAGNADRLLWNHELVKLVHADGKVTGAIFTTDEGNVQINAAQGVILATGGYPGNPDMMMALAPMAVQVCTASSYSPKDRGMGIKAGLWTGARMDVEGAPMIFNRGLVAPGVNCGYQQDSQHPAFPGTVTQFNPGSQPFMKVARDGRRFFNESSPYDFNCFAAQQHEGGVWAMVFDANAKQDIARFATDGCSKVSQWMFAGDAPVEEVLANEIEQGLVFKADTIEELADKLGFEGAARESFLSEIERYNGFFDEQRDKDFGKEAYRLSELRTAPFFGCWCGGSLLTTCDGLSIDEECRVLGTDCAPIDGLYAIGDCSGSFFANNYPEYLIGVACGRTLTEARHVVRKLAGDL